MRTNSDKNLDMISCIDDDIIERNSIQRYNLLNKAGAVSKKKWIPILSMAASFVLIVAVLLAVFIPMLSSNEPAYIVNVVKTDSIGSTDIYTITYSDGYETSFTILNNPSQPDTKITGVSATQLGEVTLTMAGGNSINIGSGVGASRDESVKTNVSGIVINDKGEFSLNLENEKSLNLGKVHGSKGDKDTFLTTAQIDKNGELIIGFSTGEVINLGRVVGEKGDKGEDGVGIQSMSVDENGELIVTLTNGTVLNLGNIKGKDGIGIEESKINDSGELVLTYTDGKSVNLGRVVGEKGDKGEDGVGISNVNITENGELIVSLTSGTNINLGDIRGNDGIGIKESKVNENGELVLTYTDGASANLGKVVGKDGADGVGIAEIKITENSELEITLTDGSAVNLGSIKGEDGKDGKSAYELYKEKYGYEGTEEEWLLDLANGNLATKQKFEVTFDTNGGSTVPSQEVADGGKVTQPETPTKAGYTFDGWYVGNEKWNFAGGSITENTTLTAKWTPIVYTITYELDGGAIDSMATTYTVEDEITLGEPVRIGGTFIGWTYEGQDTPKKDVKIALGSTGNITFVANWDKNVPLFNDDNILIYNDYNERLKYRPNYKDYAQHHSVDFYCASTNVVLSISKGTVIGAGSSVIVKLADNLYLCYENIEATSLKAGDTLEIGDAIGSFADYSVNNCMGVCLYVANNEHTDSSSGKNILEYYDYYDFHKITYEGLKDGDSSGYLNPIMFTGGAEFTLDSAPDVEFYTFAGWYLDSEYNTPITKVTSDMAKDITLYAKYDYNGLLFTLADDNTYIVSAADPEIVKCTIPSTYNGLPVSGIGTQAFKDCSKLKSVVISEGVSAIYGNPVATHYTSSPFYGCTSLESITIPKSMTQIDFLCVPSIIEGGNGMLKSVYFNGTLEEWRSIKFTGLPLNASENGVDLYINGKLLTSITLTKDNNNTFPFICCSSITSVTIEEGVTYIQLDNFLSITEVTIPSSVTTLYQYSFRGCTSLKSVTIPNSVTEIDDYVFAGCTSLESITIPDTVTEIGAGAFEGCSALMSVTIPGGIREIPPHAFHGASSLKEVVFNGVITEIGAYAFYDCSSLESIELPSSVTTIGTQAFFSTSLKALTIPEGVTSIESAALSGIFTLKYIEVDENNTTYASKDGILYNKDMTEIISIPSSLSGKVVIPEGVSSLSIGSIPITSLTIPSTVTSVSIGACFKLVEIYNLSEVDISQNENVIKYTRVIHTSLDEASILETVGDYVFMTFEGKYYLVDYVGNDTEITLPDSYNDNNYEIYQHAFYNRDDITKVTIPNGVTSIGSYAFYHCDSLVSIEIPSTVTSIGAGAFERCTSLTIYADFTEAPSTWDENWNVSDCEVVWTTKE